MVKKKFPNLDGLRFIAALFVFIYHFENGRDLMNIPNYSKTCIMYFGQLGVVCFFVLSGFLLTYILLEEEKETRTISINLFYARRILRIWPLYYLIVVISFFILPRFHFFYIDNGLASLINHFWLKLIMFLLFLPNLVFVTFPYIPYASQSWSIGVEEQFYLFWPILMKKVKNK